MDLIKHEAKKIRGRLRDDYDFWGVVDGDEGEGKSTAAYYLCQLIDPNFGPHRIAYDVYGLMDILENIPPHSAVMLDEAVELFYSREAMGRDRIHLNKMVMQIRQKNLAFILCIPNMMDLDGLLKNRRVRLRFHVFRRGWVQVWQNQKRLWQATPWWRELWRDTFPDMDPEDKTEYKRLKAAAFEVKEKELEIGVIATRLYLLAKAEKIKLNQNVIAKAFMVTQGRVSQWVAKHKDQIKL